MSEPSPDTPQSSTSPNPCAPSGDRVDLPENSSDPTLNLNLSDSRATAKARLERTRRWVEKSGSVRGTLLGDYELLDIVGRGGMGIVFKARHLKLDRITALKVTREDRVASPEMLKRFRLEAAAVAKLDHPHIVPVYEIGEVSGQQFYSMAFVEGTSLAQLVAVSPLAPQRAAELMYPVATAIAYAHSQGVVHRDLKPENILLDGADRPRVTDFGVAQFADADSRLTMAGEILGTPSYMSPEQAQGTPQRVGPLSDVYSLGATLYCLLTGRPPFQAATPLETLNQVVDREPVSPRQLNPAVDRDLETICLKCLEKAPERRYASASALAEDLSRFRQGKPILARPVSTIEKVNRWCLRNPVAGGLLAGLVTVFLTAFALVSWSYFRAQEAFREEAKQRAEAHAHERAERWERYRANMIAVSSAFQSQNISVAQQAIEAAPNVHRNWEWRHFAHQLDPSLRVLDHPGGGIAKLKFTKNNRMVVYDTTLHVMDLTSGKITRSFDDFAKWPWVIDRAGRLVAYSNKDNAIVVWDVESDRRIAVLPAIDHRISMCAFDEDSTTLAACTNDSQVLVWDLIKNEPRRGWTPFDRTNELIGCEFSGRLTMARRLTSGVVDLWDLDTGRKRCTVSDHKEHVIRAEFNQQCTRVVTAEGYPSNLIRMADAETGKLIADLRGHTNIAQDVRFSPDGKRVATCSFDQTVRLWDGVTGAPVATLQGHAGRALAICFSADSKRLASGSQDHSVRLWDATTGDLIAVLHGHAKDVDSVDFSPDGTTIASGSLDGTIRLWDVALAERNGVLRGHTSYVYGVVFHPDGERLVSAGWDATLRVWNATSGQELAVMHYPVKTTVNSVAIDPTGKMLVTLGRDDAVRLWDLESGKPIHHWPMPSNHWQDGRATFSPKGNLVAAGSSNGGVYIWDAPSREPWAVLQGHTDHVHDVAFSPDGHLLASGGAENDRTVRIWNVAKKESVQVLKEHLDSVTALAFNRDGSLLASGSRDGTVRLWNTTTWKEVAILKQGTTTYGIAFTPDGTRLATGCADNSIRFWDVLTGQEVTELRSHGSYVKAVTFSPDGTRLASASGDNTVRVWDTLSARERGQQATKSRP
jgi:WD40 repeat protein/serine/threonine protein kinase